MNTSQREICLIDAGIVGLDQLKLPDILVNLNLHSNSIKEISNLTHLVQLKYLDLSSNHIKQINGLSSCSSLQILNLACNQLSKVEGIEKLRKLKSLNLSFNQIHDLSGFKLIKKGSHSLSHVELYSNKITSLQHAIECLSKCTCLQKLEFRQGMNTNPICGIPAYRANISAQLPWLKSLDGIDPSGNKLEESTNTSDIPGLEELLDFLDPAEVKSDSILSSTTGTSENLVTPKIDSILLKFKGKNLSPPDKLFDQKEGEGNTRHSSFSEQATNGGQPEVSNRLETLEKQLTQLTALYNGHKTKTSNLMQAHSDESTTTEDEEPVPITSTVPIKKRTSGTRISQHQQKQIALKTTSSVSEKSSMKARKKVEVRRRKPKTNQSQAQPQTQPQISVQENFAGRNVRVRSTEDDETYLNLIHEIDVERERRWKAEQASRKLLDSLKSLKETLFEERKIQEAAVTFNAKLKQALEKERESRKAFEDSSVRYEEENLQMKARITEFEQTIQENEKITKELKDTLSQIEQDKIKNELHYDKSMKELQHNTGGYKRELELLRTTTEKQKDQLQQLQELLVLREQEHRDVLSNKVNIDGTEVQKLIENETLKCEARNSELVKQHIQRFEDKNREYMELEDEFRMALQIEADRYNKLLLNHEETNQNFDELKGTFADLAQKEAKARSLIGELSSMVKEQKFKIGELVKHKQEIQYNQKGQIQKLEEEIIPLRKISSKFESLQQDKERMSAHIKGQESVIQGLRSERKLWGQELAQQGASLAQEKGRLDSKVESQQREIEELKGKIADQEESIKIKCKLIDDQTDTIRKMKQDLTRMTDTNKKIEAEEKHVREELEEQLEGMKQLSQEQQDKIDSLTARKSELKSIIEEKDEEIESIKKEIRTLRGQWEERDQIIGEFEEKVIKMKKSYDEREMKLQQENKNLQSQRDCINEDLKKLQEKYDREKTTREHEFTLKLKKVIAAKDDEIQSAQQKVLQVEEEMREILSEAAAQKKSLEQRVNKLSKAFLDIQQDFK